ncbi:hypothetical protein FRZ67_23105 [Panacibacter ginsenosidivorans]|uniref:Uncharacterized protein n=1 Tax=Panacibacter ginsenosidivorans TaxID=1813871 RepID=A0A5B8VFG6_9BACT|nr:hypothetical protein [Panacibacter ginsenosidivorans]QEC70049.1 hypothetical protein FRZ67_23105 [Panacibacter ginsenosidivorans]
MLTHHIALVSKTRHIKTSDLSKVAAALQKQATRDLGPIWDIQATVDAFELLKDVPGGYWPIIIKDNIHESGAAGYHTDKYKQPFALVQFDEGWALTSSHEMCEMLVDPFGSRMVSSGSIKQGQGRVNYLVEVADPCEDDKFAYSVNGIMLSDFYTPNYFDPVSSPAVRYSYTGAVTAPKQILRNGYLSWLDPATGKWWQATYFGTKQVINDISDKMEMLQGSLRARIDRITPTPRLTEGVSKQFVKMNKSHADNQEKSGTSTTNHWEQEINRLIKPRKVISAK